MNLKNKKWIIITLIIIIGIILMILGITLNAKTGIILTNKGIYTQSNEPKIIKEMNLEEFKNIEILSKNSNIQIEKGETFGIEILYYNQKNIINWDIEKDTLKINTQKENEFQILSTGFIINKDLIKIYIPENVQMNQISIDTSTDNINISDINTKLLEIKTETGNVRLNNNEIRESSISSNTGSIQLFDNNIEKVEANTKTGNIKINNIQIKEAKILSNTGSIEICNDSLYELENKNIERVEANTTTGNIKIDNLEIKEVKISSNTGSIQIDNNNVEKIDINTTTGNIKAYNIQITQSNITTNTGSIKIIGNIEQNINASSKTGNINVENRQKEELYNMKLDTRTGNIKINEERVKDSKSYSKEKENNNKKFEIKTQTGNINLFFGTE